MHTRLNRAITGWPGSTSLLAILGIVFFSINAMTPIAGDVWAPRIFGQEQDSSLFKAISGYIRGYSGGNPRIGQFWLIFNGYFPVAYDVIASLFASAFIFVMGVMATGRTWRQTPWRTVGLGIVSLSVLWFVDREIGPIFFYEPANSNYLFAGLVFLAFLSIYQIAWSDNGEDSSSRVPWGWLRMTGFVLLSIMAGMAHETYGPATIGLLLLLLIFGKWLGLPRLRWMWVGCASFIFGYALIFFAPGQDKRYTESRFDGLVENLKSPGEMVAKLFDLFVGNGIWLLLLALICLTIRTFFGHFKLRDAYGYLALLSIGAGIVLTAIAAPIFGERLGFVSHALIALLVSAAVVSRWKSAWPMIVATLCALIYLSVEYTRTYDAYASYRAQFDAQAAAVAAAKAVGEVNVKAPAYTVPFYSQKKYLFPEFPQDGASARVNTFIARYYGVKSFQVVPSEALIAFGEEMFLKAGTKMTLVDCDQTDNVQWDGKADPLGTLVCDGIYSIQFDTSDNAWVVTGPREFPGPPYRIGEYSNRTVGLGPESGRLRIWGGSFRYDDNGAILTDKGARVGQLVLP